MKVYKEILYIYLYYREMNKIIERKKLLDGLRRDAFSALSTIKNKLDARTIAAYNRKIDDTNRKDMLEKYINAFKVINTKKTEEIITKKKSNRKKRRIKKKYRLKMQSLKRIKKNY